MPPTSKSKGKKRALPSPKNGLVQALLFASPGARLDDPRKSIGLLPPDDFQERKRTSTTINPSVWGAILPQGYSHQKDMAMIGTWSERMNLGERMNGPQSPPRRVATWVATKTVVRESFRRASASAVFRRLLSCFTSPLIHLLRTLSPVLAQFLALPLS